ncbi:MAG: hypothetical protein V3T05_09205 [Myxococcota bacterium]
MKNTKNASAAFGVRLGLLLLLIFASVDCGREDFSYKPPFLTASTDVIDFGEVTVGSDDQRTLYLINKGDTPLTLENPSGTTLGGIFNIVITEREVPPLGDVVVRVHFEPPMPAFYKTTILFPNDSHNAGQYALEVKGTGVEANICGGVTCNSPPDSACLTSDTSRHHYPVGTCDEGQCAYEPIDETCDFDCDFATGLCTGDPCMGMTCQTPPNGCFSPQGQCINGACVYTTNDGASCNDLDACTSNDSCQQGVCQGARTMCGSPPAAACLDGNTLRQWDAIGVCDMTGTCRYTPRDSACEFGCAGGACRNEPCPGGCDDGNPCTNDICSIDFGCQHIANDGASCVASSGDCPTGTCAGGGCVSTAGVTCVAEYDVDLCMDAEVAGVCAGNGDCVVQDVPAEFTCPGCPGLCLQCYLIQLCIPLF